MGLAGPPARRLGTVVLRPRDPAGRRRRPHRLIHGLQASCEDRAETTSAGGWLTRRPVRPAGQGPRPGLEPLEPRPTDPTDNRDGATRCSRDHAHGARRHRRGVGSAGSPGGSSDASRPARSTGAARPAGFCPTDTTHVTKRSSLDAGPRLAAELARPNNGSPGLHAQGARTAPRHGTDVGSAQAAKTSPA
jgi:hypothetical protein